MGSDKEKEAGVLDHGEMVRLDGICERSDFFFLLFFSNLGGR